METSEAVFELDDLDITVAPAGVTDAAIATVFAGNVYAFVFY